jgi:hypothetical protein
MSEAGMIVTKARQMTGGQAFRLADQDSMLGNISASIQFETKSWESRRTFSLTREVNDATGITSDSRE